jgi:hypothetical protein
MALGGKRLINQFTTVSLQLHVGEFDLAKITAVKTIKQYTKNTAATGWNYNRRCLVRLWMYFFVPMLEVDYRVVSDLLDEGVLVDRTLVEKFSRQTVYKHV